MSIKYPMSHNFSDLDKSVDLFLTSQKYPY